MADQQNINNAQGPEFQPNFDPNFQPQPTTPDPNQVQPATPSDQQYAYFDPSQQPQPAGDPSGAAPDFNQSQDFSFETPSGAGAFEPQPAGDPNTYGAGAYDSPASSQANQPLGQDAYGASDPGAAFAGQPVDGIDPGLDTGASLDPNVAAPVNTFEEKKTGNKLFLIIAISLVVILLGVAGFLLYLNYGPNSSDDTSTDTLPDVSQSQGDNSEDDDTTSDSDLEDEDEPALIDESLTGGQDSIATQARKFNASTTPNEWNLRKFFVPNIDDETGECLNVSVCGPNVDPDKDGLENIDEYNFDVDPLKSDTDNDKIADGDELFVYYTDPDNEDSDLDSFTDGQEVAGCFDPAVNGAGKKYSGTSLAVLEKNTSLYQLHEPTIALLRGAGALSADILGSGVPTEKCDATSTDASGDDESSDDSDTTSPDASTLDNSDLEDQDSTDDEDSNSSSEEGSSNSDIDNSNPI